MTTSLTNLPAPRRNKLPVLRRARWKRLLILIVGWFFVVLGFIGLFLPILQGFLFLGIGLYLLSLESVWARRKLDWLRRRYPNAAGAFEMARIRAARYARRIWWGRRH